MLPRDPKSHIPVPPLAGRRALLLAAVSGDGKLLAVSSPGRVERPSGHRTAPFFFRRRGHGQNNPPLLGASEKQNEAIGTRKALLVRSLPVRGPCFGAFHMPRKAVPHLASASTATPDLLCRFRSAIVTAPMPLITLRSVTSVFRGYAVCKLRVQLSHPSES